MQRTSSLLLIALLCTLASGFSCRTTASAPTRPASSFANKKAPKTRQRSRRPYGVNRQLACNTLDVIRGGSTELQSATSEDEDIIGGQDLDLSIGNVVSSLWGAVGVSYILLKAIKRVVPIALEPFGKGEGVIPLTRSQLIAYVATCFGFAYMEGYKGFQRKFSPLVVSRSFTLQPGKSPIHHLLLAPFYSMALFHATKKRMIVSWSVTISVAAIVALVKRSPYPWRNIVDAGVVVGLSWGTISILGGYAISLLTGIAPIGVDPALPEGESDSA